MRSRAPYATVPSRKPIVPVLRLHQAIAPSRLSTSTGTSVLAMPSDYDRTWDTSLQGIQQSKGRKRHRGAHGQVNAIADFLARTTPRIRTTPRNGGHLPAHQAAHAIGYSVDGGHSLHAAYRGSPHSGSMYPGSRRSVHPQRTSYNESPHPHVSDHQQQVDERRKFSGRKKSGHEYETLGPWPASCKLPVIFPRDLEGGGMGEIPPVEDRELAGIRKAARRCVSEMGHLPSKFERGPVPTMKIWTTSAGLVPEASTAVRPGPRFPVRPCPELLPRVGAASLLSLTPVPYSTEARTMFTRDALVYDVSGNAA